VITAALDDVARWAAAAGLDAHGVTDAAPFDEARMRIDERKAAGLHAGMYFTYGKPERSTDPTHLLDGARSIVVGALLYRRDRVEQMPGGPRAAVARYVWEPYYDQLHDRLEVVAAELRSIGAAAVVVLDDNRMVDRAAAYRAGLGWFGKNTNLLSDDLGSWFVLGSVVTDAVIEPANTPMADGCRSCNRCQVACPTGALDTAGVLDARRCLAWLVQAAGTFPPQFREALGDRIYGCDDCQAVCPPNVRDERTRSVPVVADDATTTVDLLELLRSSDDELTAQYGQWYIPRRRPEYLRRNALVALGNVAEPRRELANGRGADVDEVLVRMLQSKHVVEVGHAIWAARRLGRDELVSRCVTGGTASLDPAIVAELDRSVPSR